MVSNDNDTVAVNKKVLIAFIDAFDEYGYGTTSDMSVPAEWDGIIDIARRQRITTEERYKEGLIQMEAELRKEAELELMSLSTSNPLWQPVSDEVWWQLVKKYLKL